MFGLIFKVVVLVAVYGAWVIFGLPGATGVGQVAIAVAAFSGFGALLERRGLRTAAFSTIELSLESLAVAYFLAAAGLLPHAAAFAALPALIASARTAVIPNALAGLFLAGSGAIAFLVRPADNFNAATAIGLVGATLALAWITRRAPAESPTSTVEDTDEEWVPPTYAAVQIPAPVLLPTAAPVVANQELKENFRNLRSHTLHVESQLKLQKLQAELATAIIAGEGDPGHILGRLRAQLKLTGIAVYGLLPGRLELAVRGHSGDVPYRVQTDLVPLDTIRSDTHLRAVAAEWLRDEEDDTRAEVVLLKRHGELVGLVWLGSPHGEALRDAKREVELASSLLTDWLVTLPDRAKDRLACALIPSLTTETLVPEHLVQSLASLKSFDRIAVTTEDGVVLAHRELSHIEEFGLRANSEVVSIWDTHQTHRSAAIATRIGSLVRVPLPGGQNLVLATQRRGGLVDFPTGWFTGEAETTPDPIRTGVEVIFESLQRIPAARLKQVKKLFAENLPTEATLTYANPKLIVWHPTLNEPQARRWASLVLATVTMQCEEEGNPIAFGFDVCSVNANPRLNSDEEITSSYATPA